MKKLILITLSIITLSSCDKVTQTLAIKHNDAIITESDNVVGAFDAVSNSLTSFNADTITIALQKYNLQIKSDRRFTINYSNFHSRISFSIQTLPKLNSNFFNLLKRAIPIL